MTSTVPEEHIERALPQAAADVTKGSEYGEATLTATRRRPSSSGGPLIAIVVVLTIGGAIAYAYYASGRDDHVPSGASKPRRTTKEEEGKKTKSATRAVPQAPKPEQNSPAPQPVDTAAAQAAVA